MSLDKAIAAGKEHRKPYYGSQVFSASCRPGGDCTTCNNPKGRYSDLKRHARAADTLTEADDPDAVCFPYGSTGK